MTSFHHRQRGEGKIGCISTLLIVAILAALAVKLVPVIYSDNGLANAAEDLGSRAGILALPALEAQLRGKATELEIPEALAKGAMTVQIRGDKQAGTCVITLRDTRKVDHYGIYTLPITTDKTVNRPYMDAR